MAHDNNYKGTCRTASPQSLQPAADTPWAGARILLVAEDLAYCEREIIPPLLDARLQVQTTPAGGEDLPGLLMLPFELVLLDIASRQGPGYQACIHVRNTSTLPVLLVLHGAAREEAWQVYQAGADAYVLAPFDPRELWARLYALLRRQPARHRLV